MWLPPIEFTDYCETFFIIDNHWVFSYKYSCYYHKRVKLIFVKFISRYIFLGSGIQYKILFQIFMSISVRKIHLLDIDARSAEKGLRICIHTITHLK